MTSVLRAISDRLQAIEVPLFVVTFILGVYLAGGNILDAAHVPDKQTWTPWSGWFVALLVAAVWVPLYALYQAIEGRRKSRERQETQARRDLALACQQIVGVIAEKCDSVTINDLAACVWRCRDDDGFDEVARFYLPQERPPTGVTWHKGKGVAGWAWASNENLRADLRPLVDLLDKSGAQAFNDLPPSERFGLSAAELGGTREYTGICAIRLFSTDSASELLGLLILDYVGDQGFDCVATQAGIRPVTSYIGACAKVLTESHATL